MMFITFEVKLLSAFGRKPLVVEVLGICTNELYYFKLIIVTQNHKIDVG